MIGKPGRHVPAFVLLMLAERPRYGLEILNELNERLPYSRFDSAAVYKALNKLEENGCVSCSWDHSESGPPKKMYALTASGQNTLENFYDDIKMRRSNLDFFIKTYHAWKGGVDNE
ncbi:MAG: PadR family transcriptional regulator, regulatory protein PadR [Clostridiales bacterium]|jgi:DNA-binding PadR family transcriptional regulator|nr:PadR family transcriptional regulator, regulatory protein PadR [Clostridiales bacterium]MDN5299048.1 PadR family transcriptional regulator, regulatory protein PadR [Clostridiales bacterium]